MLCIATQYFDHVLSKYFRIFILILLSNHYNLCRSPLFITYLVHIYIIFFQIYLLFFTFWTLLLLPTMFFETLFSKVTSFSLSLKLQRSVLCTSIPSHNKSYWLITFQVFFNQLIDLFYLFCRLFISITTTKGFISIDIYRFNYKI